MATIADIRESLREFYGKYDAYIVPAGKFLLALLSFCLINGRLGQLSLLNNILVVLILALFCSILSENAIVVIGTGMVIGHLYALSIPALLVGGGILLILLLVYFGIAAKQGYVLIFTMLALTLKIPAVIPIFLGLLGTPFLAVAMCFGVASFYIIEAVSGYSGTAAAVEQTTEVPLGMLTDIQNLIRGIVAERELFLMVVVLIAALILVYVIRRMAIRQAWRIAVVAGTLVYFAVYSVGAIMLGISGGILWAVLGSILAVVLGMAAQLLFFNVDYARSMRVQFEDDSYYYYVQAIPKIKKEREQGGEH